MSRILVIEHNADRETELDLMEWILDNIDEKCEELGCEFLGMSGLPAEEFYKNDVNL